MQEFVTLGNDFGRVEVSTIGAQVVSYVPFGCDEILFMPEDRAFSSDRAMHGGIPVCWPWFGRFGAPGSRMHGLARYARWQVAERTSSRVVLSLDSSAATLEVWPFDFKLRLSVELNDRLCLTLLAENTSDAPFEVSEGFHPYFRASDPQNISVFGLPEKEVRAFPGIDGGRPCQPGGTYCLKDAATGRCIEMTSNIERKIVIWNPGPNWSDCMPGGNLGKDDWKGFVCVEPAIYGPGNAVRLSSGESSEFKMSIRVISGTRCADEPRKLQL